MHGIHVKALPKILRSEIGVDTMRRFHSKVFTKLAQNLKEKKIHDFFFFYQICTLKTLHPTLTKSWIHPYRNAHIEIRVQYYWCADLHQLYLAFLAEGAAIKEFTDTICAWADKGHLYQNGKTHTEMNTGYALMKVM